MNHAYFMKKTPIPRPRGRFLQTAIIRVVLPYFALCMAAKTADDAPPGDLFNDPSAFTIQQAVQKWKNHLGPVDFAEKEMFWCMAYLHPQPKSKFTRFTDEKVAERIQIEFEIWVSHLFKAHFYALVKGRKPSRYYLNRGRPEASLLMYEGDLDGYALTIVENYNVLFLTIAPTNGTPAAGFSAGEVATILTNWLNVSYRSIDEVLGDFSLPNRIELGRVFTNKKYPEVGKVRDWRDYIVGFQSTEGLCLMIFKAQAGRPSGSFAYDYNWLNKWMYKADGYTLLDPPKNQPVNDPYHVGRPVKPR